MMTLPQKTFRTTLNTLVIVGVLASAGCSTTGPLWTANPRPSAPSPAYTETKPVKAAPGEPASMTMLTSAPDGSAPGQADVTPAVNVFGELGAADVRRVPKQSGGAAGFQQQSFLDEGHDGDVSVSPDGKWMAFSSTRHSEKPDLYLQRTDGLSVIQLTSDSADDAYPAFSPDGKQVTFCSSRAGNWDIYLADTDGKNVVQVTSGPMQDIHPSFSPDGSKLVYASLGGKSGQWELWTVDLASNAKKMVGFGLFPTWSPEKGVDRIAFQRARQRGSRWFSIWTLDLVDGEARRVTEVAVSSNAALVSPSWSPDGKKLAFAAIVEPTPAGDDTTKPGRQQDIWVVNADGSGRHRITDGSGTNVEPWWSVDNKIYFVSDRGGAEAIWSALIDAQATQTARGVMMTKEALGAADTGEAGR